MNITGSMLVDQLVERHHYTKKAAKQLVDDFMDIILYNMEQGNSVSLYGFGCFDLVERKPHATKHPNTGEYYVIPAHWMPKFYPAVRMKTAVKLWEDNQRRGLN